MSKKTSNSKKNKIYVESIVAPVEAGATYDIDIHGLGSSGEGVGRYDGFTVFVPFALPGERVQVTMEVVKKNYGKGKLERVLECSPNRVEPICPVYGQCGGCRLQHVSYDEQLRLKTKMVKDIIERIGKDDPEKVHLALGPEQPWSYRNKMQMPVGGIKGQVDMGFYAMESHRIVPYLDCHIQMNGNNRLSQACYELMQELDVAPYDEVSEEGILRHVIGRINKEGQVMAILVTATRVLPYQEQWIQGLRARLPECVSIVQNINPKNTNVIMGQDNVILWGQEQIEDSIGHLSFLLSPHSFFQVNPLQTEVLYNKALSYAALEGHETVIDAYCGTGTISLFLAQKAKEVIGIEIVEPAVEDARKNAQRNGATNVRFIAGDATEIMPVLYKQGVRPHVIVFDPVRAGCKENVLTSAIAMKPERIVYVSCNPASMARDITVLKAGGYELIEVQPVDMFSMTSHVEAVALLVKKGS